MAKKLKSSLFSFCRCRRGGTAINLAGVLVIAVVVIAVFFQYYNESRPSVNPIDVGASVQYFTEWELSTWLGIKDRVEVFNSDPDFPDPDNRVLGWYSMRNSSSCDYYQKSMEFLCFWEGRGADGEWEAVVSIYNVPNSTSDFVVEVSRFTWHSLEVKLDGSVVAEFPQVTENTVSLGYCTFEVLV